MRINAAGGFTKVPHQVFEFWLPLLTSAELSLLMFGIRQTIGWDVESSEQRFDHERQEQGVRFSIQDVCTFTGLHRNSVMTAIDVLSQIALLEMIPIGAARWYFVVIHLEAERERE